MQHGFVLATIALVYVFYMHQLLRIIPHLLEMHVQFSAVLEIQIYF